MEFSSMEIGEDDDDRHPSSEIHHNPAFEPNGNVSADADTNFAKMGDDKDVLYAPPRYLVKCGRYGMLCCCLAFVFCLMTVLFGGLYIWMALRIADLEESSIDNYCTTSACIYIADSILSKMNDSADPCDDFYQYACGSWLADNFLADDESILLEMSAMSDLVDQYISAIVEADPTSEDSDLLALAKTLYSTCMDEETVEALDGEPLLDMVERYGGWPMLNSSWDVSSWDINNASAKAHGYYSSMLRFSGLFPFIDVTGWPDPKNTSVYIITLDEGAMMGDGVYYIEDEYVEALETFYTDLITALNPAIDTDYLSNRVNETLAFQKKLANITTASETRTDKEAEYNKMTIKELNDTVPPTAGFDWLLFLQYVFDDTDIAITEDVEILVKTPDYCQRLMDLFDEYGDQNETIADSIASFMFPSYTSFLSSRLQTIYDEFEYKLSGAEASPRADMCTTFVNNELVYVVGKEFVETYYSADSQTKVEEMVDSIRDAFMNMLEDSDWMSDDTKSEALIKAEAMDSHLGYPDWIMDADKMAAYYDGMDYPSDQLFASVIYGMEQWRNKQLSLVGQVPDFDYIFPPTMVNAYYAPSEQAIFFPAAILQRSMYDPGFPMSVNFGGIGMIIGHEITHGFDSTGRQYDEHGNLYDWWSNSSSTNFDEKTQCMVEQYDNYVVKQVDTNINGLLTLGENIADDGGIKQTYWAYRSWVESSRNGEEELLLPGVDLTHNQVLFTQYAQLWCTLYTDAYLEAVMSFDVHSTSEFRVKGPLSNFDEFSTAFSCPVGSAMNPEEKCSLW